MELEPVGTLYGTCSDCGQVVRNTPLDWHTHICHAPPTRNRKAAIGFTGKVNPGGSGHRLVMESYLQCELIALETDLTRWNEFAEFECERS